MWQLGYRLPIIAAVNGACAGVGLALALWCGLRFVAADAKITNAAAELGLPGHAGRSAGYGRLLASTTGPDAVTNT